ncbi:protein angel homolog 2 [Latimeria chalumnae]|uniref:protein angel homolog 2 n=1 Tax=Latimeria chalumnae TaxID=7897 RepID=UPI00313D7338
MLARHLQNRGRSWIAHSAFRQDYHMTINFSNSAWWTRSLHWLPYPHLNFRYRNINISPPAHLSHSTLRPGPPFQKFRPFFPIQSNSFHYSGCSMEPKDHEPQPKRRKSEDAAHQDKRPSSHGDSRGSSLLSTCNLSDVHGMDDKGARGGNVLMSNEAELSVKSKESKRHWEDFSYQYKETIKNPSSDSADGSRGEEQEEFDFTVMSYNILSQDLLEDNAHLYRHCKRAILQWSYRVSNILQEVQQMNADILCLQEVQEDHYNAQIKPSLESLGYRCEYKMRTGRKPDGCAICFKLSKFSLVLAKPVEFFRYNIRLLDRDNIALVVLLQPTDPRRASTHICVANTHLLYNPRRGDIKLTQLALLLAEVDNVAHQKDGTYCPIILCGDFNSTPVSPLYSFIKEGNLEYGGLPIGKVSGQEKFPKGQRVLPIPLWPESLGLTEACQHQATVKQRQQPEKDAEPTKELQEGNLEKRVTSRLQHGFCLSSVYSHYLPDSEIPEITTCHSRTALTVDYIFYSADKEDSLQEGAEASRTGHLKLLGRLSLLTAQDLWAANGLPNESSSSDHVPLLAKFRLLP